MVDWRFLLDENIDPKSERLWKRKASSQHTSVNHSWQGADDEEGVLRWARALDVIVVTPPELIAVVDIEFAPNPSGNRRPVSRHLDFGIDPIAVRAYR